MKVRIVGIDPGKTGAIALLDLGSRSPAVYDIPLLPGTKGKEVMDYRKVAELLAPPDSGRIIAVLEGVSARPTDGSVQAFQFGRSFGALEMALIGHGYEMHYPTPNTWKRHFNLTKLSKEETDSQAKERSRGLALQRFPDVADHLKRKMDHGRAEAMLLALYGAEKLYTS